MKTVCNQSVILTLLVGLCVPTAALSQSRPTTQPVQWQEDEHGWTAFVPMENAPFPHASRENGFTHGDRTFARDPHYTDSTVALFVPRAFKPGERTDLLVYFHGHMTNVRQALDRQRLREQVVASGRNVILVFPQGPKEAADSGGGRLEEPGALKRLVDEVMETLETAGKVKSRDVGRVLLAGHSGAYRVISFCLEHGGLDDSVKDVCLLDATYDRLDAFAEWAVRHPEYRLFSIFTAHLADENKDLMQKLTAQSVPLILVTNDEGAKAALRSGRIVFYAVSNTDHNGTVQWLEPWLRTAE